MKTNLQRIIIATVLFMNAVAANAIFVPAPAEEEKPWSIDFGIDPKMYWYAPYTLKHFGASVAATYNVWEGLSVGLQLRGGINDNSNGLFNSNSKYIGDLGGDLMVRYLITFCNHLYLGAQIQYGYDYLFYSDGNADSNSYMFLSFGVPFGISFSDVIAAYVMPAVELGNRSKGDGYTVAGDTHSWGSLVSGALAIGTTINLGGPWLVVELQPRIDDFNNPGKTTGLKTFAGLAFEL